MADLGHKKKDKELDFSIARYCAYQERAHSEVQKKLKSYGLNSSESEDILAWLITENYLNEERYAHTIAGGKFRAKKWGKLKIEQFLRQKDVSEYSINKALSQLDLREYQHTLELLIRNKYAQTSAANIYELRNKIARYIISKGFESYLVWEEINNQIDK